MPRRTVLSTSQRASFEALPVEPVELARHYTLGEADLTLIRKRRRASNRIGFVVQLCLSRYPGRTLRAGEEPPSHFLAFVAEQTNTKTVLARSATVHSRTSAIALPASTWS